MATTRPTRPWPDVLAFYEGLAEEHPALQPMVELVRFLAGSRYARSLYPAIGDDGLLIGRAPRFTPGDDELQVRFDLRTRHFTFTHLQHPGDMTPWSRECEVRDWRTVLERLFHKRLQWFHEG